MKPKPKTTTPSRVARLRKPDFITYCDPQHGPAPKGEGWVREVKWDGYRAQAHLDDGRVKIFTRNGNDWSSKFWPIAEAVSHLGVEEAIMDGEVVALDENGVSDFHELRRQLGQAKPRILFQAFDLLWLDAEDLRPLPYVERKARLNDLLGDDKRLVYVPYFEEDGKRMLKSACQLGLEGIVSKRLDSPYKAGRSNWVKTKCEASETFRVIGYSHNNDRVEGLYLGRQEGDELVYAGAVEHGFSAYDLSELRRRFTRLIVRKPPLPVPPKKPGARWVKPDVLVEVSYPNKSADGRLRHPSFKGLRDDIAER